MRAASAAGFTLAELLVVLGSIAALFLLAGLLKARTSRTGSRRAHCASNLSQIGKACNMYADVGTNMGHFPNDGTSALRSLNLTHKGYVQDARVFQCPLNPKDSTSVVDTCNENAAPNMNRSMTAYGYDRRHTQSHGLAAVAADHGDLDPASGNSFNHKGADGKAPGQNMLQGDGHVEWLTSPQRDLDGDGTPDDHIFANDTPKLGDDEDGWIRDD
ncbi:MAG: hypothetical protein HS116_13915 [Planctomycetes bacterium]|nr:hypothetical protein [Planctomycetota bacterium]